tara:strand:- start:445 stop:657 length:213 start_codon:yes stop_codon:yes gene_type:complete
MIPTKRKMKRKQMLERIAELEYYVSNLVIKSRNLELVVDYYVEMKGDSKKFDKFLEKKSEDAESTKSKPE